MAFLSSTSAEKFPYLVFLDQDLKFELHTFCRHIPVCINKTSKGSPFVQKSSVNSFFIG